MATRTTAPVAGWSQDKQRGFAIFFDQHKDDKFRDAAGDPIFAAGRPWGAVVERSATGAAMPMPVGPISPIGWAAPWYPDEKYIVKSLGKIAVDGMSWMLGQGASNRFSIDYAAMLRDYREAHQAYYDVMVQEHLRVLPGARVPGPGEPVPYQVQAVIGRPPKSPKIPEAAIAGHRWLLGQQMPVWNPASGKHEVPVDEGLAEILSARRVDVLTIQQKANEVLGQASEIAEMKRMLGELLAERETAKFKESVRAEVRAEEAAKKPKGKKTSTVPAGTE